VAGALAVVVRLRSEIDQTNLSRLRVASGVSRQSLAAVRDGHTPNKRVINKIVRGLRKIEVSNQRRGAEAEKVLAKLRRMHEQLGLRPLAERLGIDHSTLSQVLMGKRKLMKKLEKMLDRMAEPRVADLTR
jgi:predicted transcriptional regulator